MLRFLSSERHDFVSIGEFATRKGAKLEDRVGFLLGKGEDS